MIMKIALTRDDLYQQVLAEKTSEFRTVFHLHDRDIFEINLILDEICTNIFAYNPGTPDLLIDIEATCRGTRMHIRLRDNGIPFEPTASVPPDTGLPLEEREPGGLGLMLVKKFSNSIAYKRLDGWNQTIITKKLR